MAIRRSALVPCGGNFFARLQQCFAAQAIGVARVAAFGAACSHLPAQLGAAIVIFGVLLTVFIPADLAYGRRMAIRRSALVPCGGNYFARLQQCFAAEAIGVARVAAFGAACSLLPAQLGAAIVIFGVQHAVCLAADLAHGKRMAVRLSAPMAVDDFHGFFCGNAKAVFRLRNDANRKHTFIRQISSLAVDHGDICATVLSDGAGALCALKAIFGIYKSAAPGQGKAKPVVLRAADLVCAADRNDGNFFFLRFIAANAAFLPILPVFALPPIAVCFVDCYGNGHRVARRIGRRDGLGPLCGRKHKRIVFVEGDSLSVHGHACEISLFHRNRLCAAVNSTVRNAVKLRSGIIQHNAVGGKIGNVARVVGQSCVNDIVAVRADVKFARISGKRLALQLTFAQRALAGMNVVGDFDRMAT